MNKTTLLICTTLATSLLLGTACGKKDNDKSSEKSVPGVQVSTASTVALSGTLNLPLNLTATQRGVLAFKLIGGSAKGEPQVVDVDADGNFSFQVDKSLADVDFINAQFALPVADRKTDELVAAIARVVGVSADEVKNFMGSVSDTELQAQFAEELKSQKQSGTVTLLVAYDKSGDKVAEAASFRFIGLPTAGGSLLTAIDTQAIKGNLSFGTISPTTGDEATAQLSASDALSISASAQESLASSGKALKSIKNNYMNSAWKAGQFFAWQDKGGLAGSTNQFSSAANTYYDGAGFYIGSISATPFNYDQVCGDAAGVVNFRAPVAVAIGHADDQGNPTNVTNVQDFKNTNLRRDSQGGERNCVGDNFYARENVGDATGGETGHSFMLNFGRLLNATPEGLWKLSYNDAELARFELGAASPIDSNGKPTVFMPSSKFIESNGQVTGAVIEMTQWNGTEYVKVTDLSGLKKLISSMNASVSRVSDHGETRAVASYSEDNTQFIVTFDNPVASSDVDSYSTYYEIGDSNYRIEYRRR